ncbi:hypothetical protein RB195_004077 [Necator americanus]
MRIIVLLAVLYSTRSSPTRSTNSESAESYEDEEESWECGTDAFSKYFSENQIELDCPKLKKTVNQCCVSHDKCYDDQLGRKHCDDTFCDCLDRVTRGYEVCNKEDGPLFCGMVRQFGADAYLRSGNHTVSLEESQDEIIHAAPNNTNTNSSSSHDYDYESAVSANDTAIENFTREKTDLLEVLLRSA